MTTFTRRWIDLPQADVEEEEEEEEEEEAAAESSEGAPAAGKNRKCEILLKNEINTLRKLIRAIEWKTATKFFKC